jgi:Polysulphide reductase, NrfD
VHWKRYEVASILLAGIATPLVVSVHTVVSFDFTIAILPGWHSTIFPPYFVAGAIYSGFAMVLCLMIPMRWAYHLEDMITMRHLNIMGKVMLATGLVVGYGYLMEAFMAFFSADRFEIYATTNRPGGPYAAAYWCLITFNVIIPQGLWSKRVRTSVPLLFLEAFLINCAMWLERFVIIIVSLHRDFLPSAWRMYAPTRWDWMTLWGSVGLFLTLFYLFIRFLPMISIYEMRELVAETERHRWGPQVCIGPITLRTVERDEPCLRYSIAAPTSFLGSLFMCFWDVLHLDSSCLGWWIALPTSRIRMCPERNRFPSVIAITPMSWESIAAIVTPRWRRPHLRACPRQRSA